MRNSGTHPANYPRPCSGNPVAVGPHRVLPQSSMGDTQCPHNGGLAASSGDSSLHEWTPEFLGLRASEWHSHPNFYLNFSGARVAYERTGFPKVGSGLPKRCAVMLMACSCKNGSSSIRPEVVTGPA